MQDLQDDDCITVTSSGVIVGNECLQKGCRWSIIYQLNGGTMIIIAVNILLLVGGVWNFHLRAMGACCASALCCVNLAAIITTTIFRFNTFGKLAALSTLPTKYENKSGDTYPPVFSDS